MSSFHDNIDERLDDMLEIYGARAVEKAEQDVSPDFDDQPTYDDTGDESSITNLDEFYEYAAENIADFEKLGKSALRDIIVGELTTMVEDSYAEKINDDLWQARKYEERGDDEE